MATPWRGVIAEYRTYLPFADDDPMTAEVIAKVLLLANDRSIKDPGILEQLVRAG